ncbi:MAG: hypothetical protein LBL71_02620 [Endomicrobium sp.]|jgi:hypothetical protein|nr:hypothetical protein [Endomicrobium sp.]
MSAEDIILTVEGITAVCVTILASGKLANTNKFEPEVEVRKILVEIRENAAECLIIVKGSVMAAEYLLLFL